MSSSTLFRWGGIAGLLSGLLLAIVAILPESALVNAAGLLSVTLGLYVLTALYLGQRAASGALGGIGYIVNFFGGVLIAGVLFANAFVFPELSESVVEEFTTGTAGLAFLVSFAIFNVGVVLTGIATIRAKVYPSVAAALYMVGFLASFVVAMLSLPEIVSSIGELLAAVGIFWFGYALWSGTVETAGQPEPAA
jgi:hypothetical protein